MNVSLKMIGCALVAGLCSVAFAQDQQFSRERRDGRREQRTSVRALELGICVGQTLALQSQPIVLTPGQALTTDDVDALQAAILACRTQMAALRGGGGKGGDANPTPSPTPAPGPGPAPVPVTPPPPGPVPTPTPTPSN